MTTWAAYELRDERHRLLQVHVVPCNDDGEVLCGHEVTDRCLCRPVFNDGVWVQKEDS